MKAGWRTADIISGDQLFGRQVAILAAILSALTLPANSPAADHGSLAARMALAGIASVASFGLLQIIRIAILAWVKGSTRATTTLISIFATSTIGGVLLQIMLTRAQFTDDSTMGFRQIHGLVVMGFSMCIASYIVANLDSHARRIDTMQTAQTDLERSLHDRQSQHEIIITELLDKVDALINSEVSELEGQSPRALLSQLRRVATDVIRPIGHELSGEISQWTPALPSTTRKQYNWVVIINSIQVMSALRPLIITATTIALTIPTVAFSGIQTFIGKAIVALVLVPLGCELARFLVNKLPLTSMSLVMRIVVMAIALVLSVVPYSLVAQALWQDAQSSMYMLKIASFAALYSGILTAILQAVSDTFTECDDEFARTRATLNWSQARLNLIQWYQRAEVARALHGPIQTAVSQVLPKISEAVTSNTSTLGLVGELQRRIVSSLGSLVNPRAEAVHLEHELTDIYETWQGGVEIAFDVKRELLVAMSTDPACATAFIEAVHEGCTNAVKHGGANQISITVTEAPSAINLIIADNGRGLSVQPSHGLGTKLLDASCVSWYRRRIGERTIVTATFPYLPEHHAPTRRVLTR